MHTAIRESAWGLALAFIFASSPLLARTSFGFVAPIEFMTPTGAEQVFTDGVYERDTYDGLGADFPMTVDKNTNPGDGDRWVLSIEDSATNVRVGEATLSYDLASDCFLFQGSPVLCGVRVPPDSNRSFLIDFPIFFFAQCIRVRDYRMIGEFFPGGTSTGELLGNSPIAFQPTQFPIGVPELVVNQTTLRPLIPRFPISPGGPNDTPGRFNPEIPGDSTAISVRVEDAIVRLQGGNCGVAVANVPLTLKTTVIPMSGGHDHFNSSTTPGTGTFSPVPFLVPQPTVSTDATQISGQTDVNGNFFAIYNAGDTTVNGNTVTGGEFGVQETLTVEAQDLRRGITQTTDKNLAITVPDLVPMLSDGSHYILAGTGGACDTPHNPDPFNMAARQSHYVTRTLFGRLIELSNRYFIGTADENGQNGAMLSFNDASLPLGGVFDDGSGRKPIRS